MNNSRPTLHISIYCQESPKSKTKLYKKLSAYADRVSCDPSEPFIDLCLDTFDSRNEKLVQQALIYDTVISYSIKQKLKDVDELFAAAIILIDLTRKRLYDNNANCNIEDWMMMAVIPSKPNSKTDKSYDIEWSLGR